MKLLLSLILFTSLDLYSQPNLVPNPSFEQRSYCPPGGGGGIADFYPGVSLNGWYNPNTCTPDYFTACNYPPLNNYQTPDSQSFIGISAYDASSSNIREYLSCQLLDSLQENVWYRVAFYTRVVYGLARFASNNLGVHFSDTALHADNMYLFNYYTPPLLEAQIKYFNNEVISDSAHWTLVSGLYQAHGGEKFLTLGNFNTDAQTTQGMEYMDGIVWQSYFAIDMVSVIPLDSLPEGIPAYAGADTTIFINDTAFIGQKISNMPSVWHKLDGTQIASNTAGVYVSPQETTSYVVSHTLNGIFSADTVTVTVIDNLGVEENNFSKIKAFPVPNNGIFKLQGNLKAKDLIQIVNLEGKPLEAIKIEQDSSETQISTTLSSGTYMVLLKDSNEVVKYRNKIVVIK